MQNVAEFKILKGFVTRSAQIALLLIMQVMNFTYEIDFENGKIIYPGMLAWDMYTKNWKKSNNIGYTVGYPEFEKLEYSPQSLS